MLSFCDFLHREVNEEHLNGTVSTPPVSVLMVSGKAVADSWLQSGEKLFFDTGSTKASTGINTA